MKTNRAEEYHYLAPHRKRPAWLRAFDFFWILLTLGLALGLMLAYVATRTNPNDYWALAFFGLAAPFLFLGNILCLLFWVIRWRIWFVVPLLTLLCGAGHLGALVQFRFAKEYPTQERAKPAHSWKILTYNIHGFSYRNPYDHDEYRRTIDSVAAYIRREQPDVICFQEFETMNEGDLRLIDRLFEPWAFRAFNFVIGGQDNIGYGTAVFSRIPMLESRRIRFEDSSNSMLYVDLKNGNDTVRLFNNHLQSTQIDEQSRQRVENFDPGNEGTEQLARNIGSHLKANYKRRAMQVDSVARIIAQTTHPVIVVGDFNDTPVSYTYRQMRGELVDTFVEQGDGYGYTFNRLFSMLRIDYILHSDELHTEQYRSDRLPYSDHNPVVARIGLPVPRTP